MILKKDKKQFSKYLKLIKIDKSLLIQKNKNLFSIIAHFEYTFNNLNYHSYPLVNKIHNKKYVILADYLEYHVLRNVLSWNGPHLNNSTKEDNEERFRILMASEISNDKCSEMLKEQFMIIKNLMEVHKNKEES